MSANSEKAAHEDRPLVTACLAGDRSAQRQLFHHYKTRVHHTLSRIFGPTHELDDLVQESFVQVFRSLGSFRYESSLSTWVSRITTRVAYARMRSKKRDLPRVDLAPTPAEDPSPRADRALEAKLALAELYGVLDKLDAKYRLAYALHVIDGRPMAEVAKLTDASVTAVKSRVHRARKEVERRAARSEALAGYMKQQGAPS